MKLLFSLLLLVFGHVALASSECVIEKPVRLHWIDFGDAFENELNRALVEDKGYVIALVPERSISTTVPTDGLLTQLAEGRYALQIHRSGTFSFTVSFVLYKKKEGVVSIVAKGTVKDDSFSGDKRGVEVLEKILLSLPLCPTVAQ